MCRAGERHCDDNPTKRAAHNARRRANHAEHKQTVEAARARFGDEQAGVVAAMTPGQARGWAAQHLMVAPEPAPPPPRPLGSPQDWGFAEHGVTREGRSFAEVFATRAAANAYAESLTDEQRAAVLRYTGSDYSDINHYARTGESAGKTPDEDEATCRALDSAIAAYPEPDEPSICYRGISTPEYMRTPEEVHAWAARSLPVGSTVEFPAYTSTSHNPGVAATWQPYGVVVEMATRKGASVEGVSLMKSESERLIGRGTTWRVVGVSIETYIDKFKHRAVRAVVQVVDEDLLHEHEPATAKVDPWGAKDTSAASLNL